MQSETATAGTLYLDYLTWEGEPQVKWESPRQHGRMWRRAWVDAVDHYFTEVPELFRLAQDGERGLLMQGTRQWKNIAAQATLTPYMAKRFGLAIRVQGLQRYYALLLDDQGKVELVRVVDEETVLAEGKFEWRNNESLRLRLQVLENELQGWIDDTCVITAVDSDNKLTEGGIALVIDEGCICVHDVAVQPAQKD